MTWINWNSQYADVNNIRMHYVREGDPSKPALILLHGWPEFWFAWSKVIPALSEDFDVIAPDLRGFGDTDKPEGAALERYRPEDHVDDILGLIDVLGLKDVGIVTHDVGAMVTQALGQKAPEKLRGLFFFNCPYPGIGPRWCAPKHLNDIWYQGFHQQPWAADLLSTSKDAIRIYFGNMLRDWAHDATSFTDDDVEMWTENFSKPGNLQGGFNWYSAVFPRRLKIMEGTAPAPVPINVPTCIRWGEYEPFMLIEYADRLGEYFSDLDFKPAPDAGHFVHWETPDFAIREIKGFFGKL
ncbi:MAG: alpha/beta hydrolase [Rhodospirillales bacterium]|nr:alpha/beta hydrolase [Rhodospirillales bacterium]